MAGAKRKLRRCATYTRKSSEEGLEQDFNSLDAQREACEAYIRSQAGEGWKSLRARYEKHPRITFLGDVAETPSYLRSLDVYVLPSRSEGLSMALLEAMATGLPIVATDVGSNREVLDNGRAGVLVDPESGAIAHGMTRVLSDPETARELGQSARDRAERRYSLRETVSRHEDIYEELAGRSAPGGTG